MSNRVKGAISGLRLMVGSEVSVRYKHSELNKIEKDFSRIKDAKREILILVEDAAKDNIKKRYAKTHLRI